MKTKENFDCLAFKDRAQMRAARDIKGMTPAQIIAYYDRRVAQGPFSDLWKSLSEQKRPMSKSRVR
ncbi:MAG: hypothetical protein SGI88_09660 [Candidatus Hydrogenedentes bacterium]|nr:hypothetical protein [Candidatus Hydrogenedentota bacterium]